MLLQLINNLAKWVITAEESVIPKVSEREPELENLRESLRGVTLPATYHITLAVFAVRSKHQETPDLARING